MSYYKKGDHNITCARSGFKVKRSECRWEYENGKRTILVWKKFWKKENPQNRPPRHPKPSIPDYVNAPTFNFVSTNEVTAEDL